MSILTETVRGVKRPLTLAELRRRHEAGLITRRRKAKQPALFAAVPRTLMLYLTPPSTDQIREHVHAGRLGAIVTPSSGNHIPEQGVWAADSGIFGKTYIGDEAYMRWLEERAEFADRCLFATAPNVVGNAFATINRSYPFLQRIRDMGYPVTLVAQDNLEFCNWWGWDDFDCLFIGGSTSWKLSPAAAVLARAARAAGLLVHVGRVRNRQQNSVRG